ncbi:hypothetical protein PFICI_05746 [Pestalotiopsis fici W106-1]|uniref:Uncharacterized protein n=1 Tax=Pestalotiopsis fici (strain W106-1 / CGMCC3.15140) TaxID=1229662 RepID=W3XCT2_PESFW|nr:uncharacterized protein PFICI_05746 [Pestalotiopsis fici W106-1]ETS83870.1 hypothetical protein PFICI_05746 [Pestalotiopsis fici W106-1]
MTSQPRSAQEMQQQSQKVQLSLSLSTSPPHAISIQDPYPSEPLQLIASIKQTASPFPDRAVTILTKYSCLDTTPTEDAFFIRTMRSPQITASDSQCPAPELPLHPVARHITTTRISGNPDLLKRGVDDGFDFITVPPLGQGHAEVAFELAPDRLVQRLGNKDESVQDKLLRLLRPGDSYKIVPSDLGIRWWAFGSLDGENGLREKKIARWTFPDDLPLVREPGEDETDEIALRLRDLVDLHDVNHLSSRSAVEGEQRPRIGIMHSEGWVFGEPQRALVLVFEGQEKGAIFTIDE